MPLSDRGYWLNTAVFHFRTGSLNSGSKLALQPGRRYQAGQFAHRREYVDQLDEGIRFSVRLPGGGHDQGHAGR